METVTSSDFKKLICFLEEAVKQTCDARHMLSSGCEEVRQLLNCWTQTQNTVSGSIPRCVCSNKTDKAQQIDGVVKSTEKKTQDVHETYDVRQPKVETKFGKIMSGNAGCTKSSQAESNDKKNSTISFCLNGTKMCTEKSNLRKKSICKQPMSANSISAFESKNTTKRKLVKLKKVSPALKTTYQTDYSTALKSVRNKNNGNQVLSIHQVHKQAHVSAKSVYSRVQGHSNSDNATSVCNRRGGDSEFVAVKKEQASDEAKSVCSGETWSSENVTDKKENIDGSTISVCSRDEESLECITKENTSVYNNKNCEMCKSSSKLDNHEITQNALALETMVDKFTISNILPELIHNFGLHYNFLLDMQQNRVNSAAIQNAAASKAFLKLFFELTKASWNKNLLEPLGRMFADLMHLSIKVFCAEVDISSKEVCEKLELKNLYESLEKRFLKLSTSDTIVNKVRRSRLSSHNSNHSITTQKVGIWHQRQSSVFKSLSGKPYIFYKDVGQWQQLQKNLQLMQQLHFQVDILELLLSEMIPLLWRTDPNSKIFQTLLKTVWVLTDIMRLPIPVLIVP